MRNRWWFWLHYRLVNYINHCHLGVIPLIVLAMFVSLFLSGRVENDFSVLSKMFNAVAWFSFLTLMSIFIVPSLGNIQLAAYKKYRPLFTQQVILKSAIISVLYVLSIICLVGSMIKPLPSGKWFLYSSLAALLIPLLFHALFTQLFSIRGKIALLFVFGLYAVLFYLQYRKLAPAWSLSLIFFMIGGSFMSFLIGSFRKRDF